MVWLKQKEKKKFTSDKIIIEYGSCYTLVNNYSVEYYMTVVYDEKTKTIY